MRKISFVSSYLINNVLIHLHDPNLEQYITGVLKKIETEGIIVTIEKKRHRPEPEPKPKSATIRFNICLR